MDFLLFLAQSLSFPWKLRRTLPRVIEQIYQHGVSAVGVVVFAGIFVGLTTVIQISYQLLGIVPKYFIGMGVGRMLLIELGPVFAAFIVASRSAPAIAAELGSMSLSEQVDALRVMAIEPLRFLCLPRILATTISLPVLIVLMEVFASGVAVMVSSWLGISPETFTYGLTNFVQVRDFVGGIIKGVIFGFLIGASGCYFGLRVVGGAGEVGRAATKAMVLAAILILAFDFLIATLVFTK